MYIAAKYSHRQDRKTQRCYVPVSENRLCSPRESVGCDLIESLFTVPTKTVPEVGVPFGHTSATSSDNLRCTSGYNASSKIANVREREEVSRRNVL